MSDRCSSASIPHIPLPTTVGRSTVLLHNSRPIEAAEEEFRASLEIDTRIPRSGVVLWK
ncbi:uncharacterized protein SOCE836_003290 [Sorangium cellulosum]|uniref:Uncharacterized protein n=1 Tax=Sorangium cellulosum TaxID=56 RepID=A0A4P2QEK5_SORCE|nr:uncharacterized protein SOCE836_003290 [Sorangium cellulosum]WCQ87653.1 hypothetical protein NQZ70_00316 [Sorangium sp. Soce836]